MTRMIGISLIGGKTAFTFIENYFCELVKTNLVASSSVREELTVVVVSIDET